MRIALAIALCLIGTAALGQEISPGGGVISGAAVASGPFQPGQPVITNDGVVIPTPSQVAQGPEIPHHEPLEVVTAAGVKINGDTSPIKLDVDGYVLARCVPQPPAKPLAQSKRRKGAK